MKGLIRELRRRKVFRMAGFYIVGAWLIMQAADVFFPAWGLPDEALNILLIAAIVGFPLALVFGWFYDVTTHGIVRTPATDEGDAAGPAPLQRTDYLILAALGSIAVFIVFRAGTEIVEAPRVEMGDATDAAVPDAPPAEKLPNSIAVLPFANVSDDPSNEFFCDGISDELLHKLTGFGDLHVIGRTSSFAFKGSDYGIPRIASLLGVRYLLQGSVRKYQDQLRITAQLVDDGGTQLWSSAFDRRLEDIFAIQTEIADVVATTIVPQIVPQHDQEYEPDLGAYQLYLVGREYLHARNVVPAREALAEAVEIDPDFADAHAEYGAALTVFQQDPAELDRAQRAIDRALELKPGLPRAKAAQALLITMRGSSDAASAEALLREVLAEDPSMSDAYNWLNIALSDQGRFDEARETLERGVRVDPVHPSIAGNLANEYVRSGDNGRAEEILLRMAALPSPNPSVINDLVDFYGSTGRLVEAAEWARVLAEESRFEEFFVRFLTMASLSAALDDMEAAALWVERAKSPAPETHSFRWPFWAWLHAMPALWAGRYTDALVTYRNLLESQQISLAELDPWSICNYVRLQALAGEHATAINLAESRFGGDGLDLASLRGCMWDRNATAQGLAWAYLQAGEAGKAESLLTALEQELSRQDAQGRLHRSDDLFLYAQNALLMGDREAALDRLRRAIDVGWREYYLSRRDPHWQVLADDPRYRAMMAEVKADVDWQRSEIRAMESAGEMPTDIEQIRAGRNGG